jgi:glutathione S-transferase
VLHEKGIPYEVVEVDPRLADAKLGGPASMRVTALVDDDLTLYESMVISEYLEEKYPEPNLMGDTPRERAAVRSALLDLNVCRTQPLAKLAAMLYYDRGSRDQACIDRQLERWDAYLDELDEHFADHRWLAIDRFTVADINAYTTVAVSRGLGAQVSRGRAHLRGWLRRMDTRGSVSSSAPDSMPAVA